MSALEYPATFTTGCDGRTLVEFEDLPNVATDGADLREAIAEAMDALGSDLSIRMSLGEDIPAPSALKTGQLLVPVPLWLAPKIALHLAMRDERINNSDWKSGTPPDPQARVTADQKLIAFSFNSLRGLYTKSTPCAR